MFINVTSIKSFCEVACVFVLPRQVYLNFLLRLPGIYFSRDARMFEDAEVSRPDIEGIIDSNEVGVQCPSAKLRLHFGGGGKRGSRNSKVPQTPTSMKSPSRTSYAMKSPASFTMTTKSPR